MKNAWENCPRRMYSGIFSLMDEPAGESQAFILLQAVGVDILYDQFADDDEGDGQEHACRPQ